MLLCSCWATSAPHHQLIFNIFPLLFIIFILINLPLYNYTFSNIYLLLPFYLPTTLYLNLKISPSLHLSFILTLLFLMFFTIKICYFLFHSIRILLTQKGEYSFSLSLSLSLSLYIYIYIYISTVFRPLKQFIKPRKLAKLLLSPIKQV